MSEGESERAAPKMATYAFRFAVIFIPIGIVATVARAFGAPQLFLMILELIIPTWIVAGRFKDVERRPPTMAEATKFTLLACVFANIIGAVFTGVLFVLQGKLPGAWVTTEWHIFLSANSQLMMMATFSLLVLFQLALVWLLFRFVEGGDEPIGTDRIERNTHDVSL